MAASAFSVYNTAKKYIMTGAVDLDTNTLKMKLCTSASNASTFTLSTFASITGEISARGGYVAGGRALASVEVTSVLSAKSYSLDCADLVFTASGSALNNVKFAVIGISGGKVIAWSKLSTSQFTISSPNTLTIQFHANGIFEMH